MAGSMKPFVIVNAVFLQLLWFAAILGAAGEWMLPALTGFGLYTCWHLLCSDRRQQDVALAAIAVVIGFTLDSFWVQLHWLSFNFSLSPTGMAPLWILMLWAGLGLTVNHSMRWLQSRLVLAGILAAVSAPCSYFAASRLGAVVILEPAMLFTALSFSWALVIPGLLALARGREKQIVVGQSV